MNPEKLFDYLEGKLSETERLRLEEQLAADPQLQRELAIAREMHRRSSGSREVLLESDEAEVPSPPKPLGRRLITAFAALVLLNVFVGIAFIIGKKGDRTGERDREAATRQQLTESLQRTANGALPLPTIGDDIHLPAPAGNGSESRTASSCWPRKPAGRPRKHRQTTSALPLSSTCRQTVRTSSVARSPRWLLRNIHRLRPTSRLLPTSARSCRCESASRCPPPLRDRGCK